MAEPNGATLETPAPEQASAPTGPMSTEERMSRAFAELTSGKDAAQVRADLDREAATRDGGGESAAQPADAGGDRSQTQTPDKPDDKGKATADPKTDDKAGDGAADEDILRARAVLRRDGMTEAMIDRLERSDVLELAEHRRKVQADVDRFGANRAKDQQPPAQGAEDDDGTPPDADTDSLISQVRELDPDLAEKVSATIKASRDEVQQSRKSALKREFRDTLDSLKAEYPELRDAEAEDRVIARSSKLAATGDYQGVPNALQTVIRHAVLLEFGDRRAQQAQADLLKRNQADRAGQLDTDAGMDADKRPMTKGEKESRVLQLLKQGYTPEEARRIVAKIPDKAA